MGGEVMRINDHLKKANEELSAFERINLAAELLRSTNSTDDLMGWDCWEELEQCWWEVQRLLCHWSDKKPYDFANSKYISVKEPLDYTVCGNNIRMHGQKWRMDSSIKEGETR